MTVFFKRTLTLIVAALVAIGAGTALAQDERGGPARGDRPGQTRMFMMLDTDGDGRIGLGEVTAEQQRLIGAADLDGDGELSVDEFGRRGRWFQSLGTSTLFDLYDADGDGSLTAEEIAAPSERWFGRRDTDGDGSLEPSEVPNLTRRHRR